MTFVITISPEQDALALLSAKYSLYGRALLAVKYVKFCFYHYKTMR